ncbi:MAG: hypothetical protein JXL97_13660 [Bacteroidales bacterium]|nr:hypothetical protein [Bacteroidales bacterium]
MSIIKKIIFISLLTSISYSSYCQITYLPKYSKSNNERISIESVELTDNYTIIKYSYNNNTNSYRIMSIDKNTKLIAKNNSYELIKTVNIPISPNTYQIKPYDKKKFEIYFEPLDKGVEIFDMIESNTVYSFNIYGIKINNPLKLEENAPNISHEFKPDKNNKQGTITGKATDASGIIVKKMRKNAQKEQANSMTIQKEIK